MQQSWLVPSATGAAASIATVDAADATDGPDQRQTGMSIRAHVLAGNAISLVVFAALMQAAQLHIDLWRWSQLPFYLAGLIALLLRFGLPRTPWRHARTVAIFTEYVTLFTLVSLMGAAASYPVAALTHGYADISLQRIDEALGFDWLYWYRLVAAHPALQMLGTIVYRSIYVTPALLLWYFARAGQTERAYRFMGGFWLAAIITLALFSLMPAIGPFSHLWHGPILYMPESEQWQSGLIPALRAHAMPVIDLGHLRGIVSAPSFHTAAAVLYIAAGWRIASLRWPIVALNAAMLLSTPVEGTHYLVDMILGVLVALTSLVLVDLYIRIGQRRRA